MVAAAVLLALGHKDVRGAERQLWRARPGVRLRHE